KDDTLTLLMDFGKQTNVSNHVLLVRNQFMNGFVEGMRVGIDSTSVDHAQLTHKEFANQNVEFIETSYGNTIDKLVTGEIDATIWDASISYLPESVSMLPLKQDEESSSANTIACLIGKKSNQALNQLLIEYINPYAVKNIQNLLSEGILSQEDDDLKAHETDTWPLRMVEKTIGHVLEGPLCVIKPASTAEVSKILTYLNEHKVPVVPYGGGSGVTGGAEP